MNKVGESTQGLDKEVIKWMKNQKLGEIFKTLRLASAGKLKLWNEPVIIVSKGGINKSTRKHQKAPLTDKSRKKDEFHSWKTRLKQQYYHKLHKKLINIFQTFKNCDTSRRLNSRIQGSKDGIGKKFENIESFFQSKDSQRSFKLRKKIVNTVGVLSSLGPCPGRNIPCHTTTHQVTETLNSLHTPAIIPYHICDHHNLGPDCLWRCEHLGSWLEGSGHQALALKGISHDLSPPNKCQRHQAASTYHPHHNCDH